LTRRARLVALIPVVLASSAAVVLAQSKDDPSIGAWKLNVAKSTFTPGPPIKADTRSYEVVDGWLIVTTETTPRNIRRLAALPRPLR
jgi:hypothetical protein